MIAPRKILAIKLRAMGDTVLMTAPLLELRKAYPQAEIHALVSQQWSDLLQGHPAIDRLLTYDRHRDAASRAKALTRMAWKLYKEGYDCALNFHASPSSATLALATRAKTRSIHFHGHKDRNRYSTVEVPGKGILKPIVERDMDTVRALGLHVPAGRMPQLFPTPRDLERGREAFTKRSLPGPWLAIGIGASRPAKSWPMDRFAATALSWCKETGGSALAIGSLGEMPVFSEYLKSIDDQLTKDYPDTSLRAAVRSRVSCEIGPDLKTMMGILASASVYLGNDSGPKHVAVAVGTPTVTLFGPEQPYEWHPYSRERHPYLFIENLSCRRDAEPGMPPWCGLYTCVTEHHRCMTDLGVDEVLTQCQRVARSA